ncbi:MAG: GNAT family N-acetyltransferase [Nocardioides sp.]
MRGIEVVVVDVTDDAALRRWYAAHAEAVRADLDNPIVRTWHHIRESLRHPWDYYRRTLLSAVLEDPAAGRLVVGTAEVGRDVADNDHLADVTIAVRPAYRRRGIGTALYKAVVRHGLAEGLTTLLGEAYDTAEWRGAVDFADALGFRSVHVERHLRLTLPVPADQLAALRRAAGPDTDYRILTWADGCPDELVEEFARLQTQMLADVPLGEVDYDPPVVDVARVRTHEAHAARTHHELVAVAQRLSDGHLAGYSTSTWTGSTRRSCRTTPW